MRIGKAYQILGLTEDATARQVKETWRRLRTELHPDKHPELGIEGQRAFAEASEAYETALAAAKEARTCEACQGTGYTVITRGWNTLRVPCQVCEGEGEVMPVEEEEDDDED